MSDDMKPITKAALTLADDRIKEVAEDVLDGLVQFARQNQRTGELARNITLRKMKTKRGYTIDGGVRENYTNKSYHPMVFFTSEKGKTALTEVLKDAERKIKQR